MQRTSDRVSAQLLEGLGEPGVAGRCWWGCRSQHRTGKCIQGIGFPLCTSVWRRPCSRRRHSMCRRAGLHTAKTRRKGLSLEVSAITLHWQSGKAVWQIDTAKALVLACSTLATPRQHAAACTAPSTEHSTVVCQLVLTCSRPNAINGRSSAHAVHQTL